MPGRWFGLLLGAVGSLALPDAPGAWAQPPGDRSPAGTFRDDIQVELVEIDVLVTDRRGRPVTDLSVEDFEVHEDGERMELTLFRGPDPRSAASRGRRPADDRQWTEGPEPQPDAAGAGPSSLVVVYVDVHGTSPGNRQRLARQIAEFLARQRPDGATRYLLATGTRELRIQQPATSDPARLAALVADVANDKWRESYSDSRVRVAMLMKIIDEYEICLNIETPFVQCDPCSDPMGAYRAIAADYRAQMLTRNDVTVRNLAELMTALGGVPGPKALVYVGESLTLKPGEEMYHYLGELCPADTSGTMTLRMLSAEEDSTTLLNRLASFSNANRVTLYPIDAGGLRSSSSADARFGGVMTTESGRSSGTYRLSNALIPSTANDQIRIANHQNPLSLMADETGGRAAFNVQRPDDVLEDLLHGFRSSYSLGYNPPPESRYPIRQVQVRLTRPRPNWKLDYRRSYVLKTREQRLADRLFAALLLDEQENPLDVAVGFGEAGEAEDRRLRTVPVQVDVPGASLALLPTSSGETARVRIYLIAEHEDGGRTGMRQKTLVFHAAKVRGEGTVLPVVVNIDLPLGTSSVAVGVRDEANGRASYLVRDVTVH